MVLGDVINQGNHVLGDSIGSGEHSRVVNDRVSDIRSALGVNDRYLIIHELFGGNASEFESVVSRLDTFPDLDNAMLWIYDNYDWDPDNQGAKLIIDILVRKLS